MRRINLFSNSNEYISSGCLSTKLTKLRTENEQRGAKKNYEHSNYQKMMINREIAEFKRTKANVDYASILNLFNAKRLRDQPAPSQLEL